MVDLGTLAGDVGSAATGINDLGQVTGYSGSNLDDTCCSRAFLYSPGKGLMDLNTFLPTGSGWTLLNAIAINNAGQITGYGVNTNRETHAFLLTPIVPVPI